MAGELATRRLRAIGPVGLLVILLAAGGCGTGDEVAPSNKGTDPPSTAPPAPSPPRTPPSTPSDAFVKVRVVGVLEARDDCLVLVDQNGTPWSLLGSAREGLAPGQRVLVTGSGRPHSTTCPGSSLVPRSIEVLEVGAHSG